MVRRRPRRRADRKMADVERIDYHAGGDSDRGEREAIVPAIDLADRPAGAGGEEGADVDTPIEERIAAVAPAVPGRIEHAALSRSEAHRVGKEWCSTC